MPTEYAVADAAAPEDLRILVAAALVDDSPLVMRLFINDIIPARGTVLADYTEASFIGYSQRVLNRSAWAAPTIEVDHVARIRLTAGPQLYSPLTGGQTVHGLYLVRVTLGQVAFARRFTSPRVVVAGEPFSVNPIITLRSESYDVPA